MAGRDVIAGNLTLPQIHRQLVDAHGLALSYADFEAAWLEATRGPCQAWPTLWSALSTLYRCASGAPGT
jgi:hypothetical protein